MNYLRARYFDPTTAQFLTRDPAVAQTMSPYGYVLGNPLNGIDPNGLWPWDDFCLRNPFGGNNDNGGCHTTLSTSQGVKALAVTAAVAATVVTVGAAAPEAVAGASDVAIAGEPGR